MMQENNIQNQEVLNNILQGNQIKNDVDQDSWISVTRVVSIRYKVYFIIIAIIIWYLIYTIWPNSQNNSLFDKYISAKNNLNNKQLEISTFETKKTKFNSDMNLIDIISKQESQILECFNQNKGCENLDTSIQSNSWFIKNFLQLGNLYNEKMVVDEKILLTNIAEYLNKLDPNNTNTRTKNGDIKKINIWDPEIFTKNTYKVPIQLLVTFDNKDWLMSFINNVEKNVMTDSFYRVLYKIDEISYNIVDYTKKQDVTIKMTAYYYQI